MSLTWVSWKFFAKCRPCLGQHEKSLMKIIVVGAKPLKHLPELRTGYAVVSENKSAGVVVKDQTQSRFDGLGDRGSLILTLLEIVSFLLRILMVRGTIWDP